FAQSLLDIEEHGGLGFDWAKRDEWRAWKNGDADRSILKDSNADPTILENSVAGVARHLVHWGLTRDFAGRDPVAFSERLADAIAVYNSGRTLEESADWVQSSENDKTTGQYVAEAMATSAQVAAIVGQSGPVPVPGAVEAFAAKFNELYDQSFGVNLAGDQLEKALATNSTLREDVRLGKNDPTTAAIQLLEQMEQKFMVEGRSAIRAGTERPWPFIHNHETLYVQKSATSLIGHPLTLYEIDDLMYRTQGDRDAIRSELVSRADSRLFVQAKHVFDQMLARTERGLPVRNSEIAVLVQPLLAGYSPVDIGEVTLHTLAGQLQKAIEALDEFQSLHGPEGTRKFNTSPLEPMPPIFKGFGVAVNYQVGGR
ncbi:MAG: hypothetical protein ACRDIB_17455, partial [Ardenticatenaceae bacterium]